MKTSQFISIFLVAATALAQSDLVFQAEIKGKFVPLSSEEFPDFNFLSVYEEGQAPPPVFTLKDGIATTGTGEDKKTFGVFDDYVVFGKDVDAFNIKLGEDSKVLDFTTYMCDYSDCECRGSFQMKDVSTQKYKCVQKDIYLKPLKK